MAVPKRRHSNSRSNKRRSHNALDIVIPITCPFCNEPKISHKVCPSCGKYKNQQIINHKTNNKK